MRRWFIGVNDYWYTSCVFLEDVPLHLVILEGVTDAVCYVLGKFKIPKKFSNLKDEYGNFGQMWHCKVCVKIEELIYKNKHSEVIELPYFFLRRLFPADFEKNKEQFIEGLEDESNIKKNEKLARKVYDGYLKYHTVMSSLGIKSYYNTMLLEKEKDKNE